jgi:hypothetical protein
MSSLDAGPHPNTLVTHLEEAKPQKKVSVGYCLYNPLKINAVIADIFFAGRQKTIFFYVL